MSVGSVNNSLQVLQLLGVNNRSLSNNLAALASGNRLTSAATDVASLSIATALQSQNSALRSASSNIAQASSFLQVANGGLDQQQAIVDRLTALATQANSGSLNAADRVGLNTEFKQLRQELDRISGNTSFNGVNLLDGSLSKAAPLQSDTTLATKASGDALFTSIAGGNTIQINGQTVTAGVDFAVGASVDASVTNLANYLNTSGVAAFSNYTFTGTGNNLHIEAKTGGEAGNQFFIDRGASTAGFTVPVGHGQALSVGSVFSLQGGTNKGISAGDTSFSGSPLDNIITTSQGVGASVTASFGTASDIKAGDSIQIDNGQGGFVNFTFSASPAASNQIQLGANLEETLQNAASTINNYTGSNDYGVRQLTASVNGNTLKLTANQPGNPVDVSGAALNVNLATTGGSLSSTILNNGAVGALDVSNVVSKDFTGTLSGFKATQTGADAVQLQLKVGSDTFTATVADTTPSGNTVVHFTSTAGGSFDVTLQGGKGSSVNTQTDADAFAKRLDTAFSGITFNQSRDISSFQPSGALGGATLTIAGSSFGALNVQDVKVNGGTGGYTNLSLTINGQTYNSGQIGSELGVGEAVTLTNASNPSQKVTFTNGNTTFDVSSNAGAASLQATLKDALGVSGNNGAQFQIGASSSDIVNLKIGNTSSDALLNGNYDLLSAANASTALNALSAASKQITAERANVGSYQQSLGYSASDVASSLFNQEAARSNLEDTDVGLESVYKAINTTRNLAGIASLVQSNHLQGNILGLLK